MAASQTAESEHYKRIKHRLIAKGGSLLALLQDIEKELTNPKNAGLYPGNVPPV